MSDLIWPSPDFEEFYIRGLVFRGDFVLVSVGGHIWGLTFGGTWLRFYDISF